MAHAAGSGLVAQYHFDEGNGSIAYDASGNGNDGTISNAKWVTGKSQDALSFNGANSMVTVPDSPSLDLTTGMTIEAWVRPTSLGDMWRTVAMKAQPGQLAYALYANGAGPGPSSHVNNGTDTYATTSTALPLRTWKYLAGTYDGTTVRLYINGQLISSRSA